MYLAKPLVSLVKQYVIKYLAWHYYKESFLKVAVVIRAWGQNVCGQSLQLIGEQFVSGQVFNIGICEL